MARFFSLIVLVVLLGAIGVFAYYNYEFVDVRFLQWSMTIPLAAVAGAAYLLGMLSGWSVVGLFRRSWNRVIETPNNPRYS